jgi:hypothetical protein
MFIAALFTIGKLRKQPLLVDTPLLMNALKNVVFIYNGILFSHKEE